jgi:hypothetical protein
LPISSEWLRILSEIAARRNCRAWHRIIADPGEIEVERQRCRPGLSTRSAAPSAHPGKGMPPPRPYREVAPESPAPNRNRAEALLLPFSGTASDTFVG